MKSSEIRKLPKSSSPMFVEQWSVQGSAKAPYIVSRKVGYKEAQEWQCSCKNWPYTRQKCKHIVSVMLKGGILVTAEESKTVAKKHPLILVPKTGGVVLSKEEHEAFKKFQEARAASKSGNQFNEEGRRFRP